MFLYVVDGAVNAMSLSVGRGRLLAMSATSQNGETSFKLIIVEIY